MARPLAVLTGATGFLGGPLARALQDGGYDLRVLSRPGGPLAWDGAAPEFAPGRLGEAEAMERLVRGADLVVHAAGLIKAPDRQTYFEVNAEGARTLAAAAARHAPDARFLLVSSITAREPGLSAYGASKAAGEAAVRETLPAGRLTVVRPPAVYGPGDRETLALFKAAAALPVLPLPGGPEARVALIHVADAVAQIVAIAGESPRGAVYTLADARPEGYGWREIMSGTASAKPEARSKRHRGAVGQSSCGRTNFGQPRHDVASIWPLVSPTPCRGTDRRVGCSFACGTC